MLNVLLIKHDKMNTLNVEGFFCVISLVCVVVKILLSTKSQVINLNYLRKTTLLNFQFTIQSGINLIICQEGIVIIRGRNNFGYTCLIITCLKYYFSCRFPWGSNIIWCQIGKLFSIFLCFEAFEPSSRKFLHCLQCQFFVSKHKSLICNIQKRCG